MKNKRDKFKLLAEKRVTRAIRDLRLIGNLANRKNYDYELKDAQKVIKALEAELRSVKGQFENAPKTEEVIFTL